MKFLIVSLLIATTLLSNEIQRIEAIVEDIAKLRVSYEECKKELNSKTVISKSSDTEFKEIDRLKRLLKIEIEKNDILLTKIDLINNINIDTENLKNEIKEYKKLLEDKNVEINLLKKNNTKIVCKPRVIIQKCEELNVFPNLVMKEKYNKKETIKNIKATSFRLKEKSDIYDSINGKVIKNWEEGVSFTSNIASQNWIKITGYFIDKQWNGAKVDLWIRKNNVLQR